MRGVPVLPLLGIASAALLATRFDLRTYAVAAGAFLLVGGAAAARRAFAGGGRGSR